MGLRLFLHLHPHLLRRTDGEKDEDEEKDED
jgi:hypothetical protein